LRGKDLFRGEPGNLGIFGTLASDRASQAIAEADCVITFGSSLNYRTTDTGQLLRGKAIVQCDTNRSIIGQGATMVSAVWGVFIWREFAGAPASARRLLALMFALFLIGLALVAVAPLYA